MNYQNQEINKYINDINRIPMLTKEKESEILKQYQKTKDPKLANTVITSNLRFVVSVAHTYKGYGHPISDLIQEGNKAMLRAVEKFDPEKDIRFCSYAIYWIKAYMGNYVMKNHSMVKFGSRQIEKKFFHNLKRKREFLEKSDCEDVTKELADHFKVSEQEILFNQNRLTIKDSSLNNIRGNKDDNKTESYQEFLKSTDTAPDELSETKEREDRVKAVMNSIEKTLTQRQLFIIKNRLSADDPMTLEAIGEHFGVTRERARQIEQSLILKLKKTFEDFKD